MIFIPIHIFLDDKPTNLPKFFNEKNFGIKRRNIQNSINKKTMLSKVSIKNAYRKLSSRCDETPGLKLVASEEDFSKCFTSLDRLKALNLTQDDYTRYFAQTTKDIIELDVYLEEEVENIKRQPSTTQIDSFWKMLSNSKFPGSMLDDNLVRNSEDENQNIQITLRRIRVDALFYILAANEVEYNKQHNGDKSIFQKYLPFSGGNTLQNPSKLWLEKLTTLSGFKKPHDFAAVIPQLSVRPQDNDIIFQQRMMRKWLTGISLALITNRRYPSILNLFNSWKN